MNYEEFIAKKQASWERLSNLLSLVEQATVKGLTHTELRELLYLYRSASADFAYVNAHFPGTDLERGLNHLLARAHLYMNPPAPHRPIHILPFFLYEFPRTFRKNFFFFALSTALFLTASVYAFLLTGRNPASVRHLIPPHIQESMEKGEMWTGGITTISPFASSAIATNNISVTFATFAGGMTLGFFTIFELIVNGFLLGAITALILNHRMLLPFLSFVFPHGMIELTCIFIAGAGGLMLPDGLVFAGDLPRLESLKRRAREAVTLVLGTIPVLLLAGLVEGFISPQEAFKPWLRISLGITLAVLLYLYLFFSGFRQKEKQTGSSLRAV